MNATTHAENAAHDVASHLHPFTNLATHPQVGPLVITRGDGIFVEDDQGRRYLEAMSGLWCASLGFSNARLAKAGSDALHGLPYYHTFNGRSNPAAIALAEKLIALAPVPMSKVFFANSGSEANDSAVKLVWYYHNAIGKPAKKKIIARKNAYHGVTVVAASLSGLINNHRDFDLPIDRILHVDCPHHFRYAEPGETEEDFATRLADNLEKRILEEGPDTVGAFIAEPVMGAGGVLVPPATYFEKVQKVLAKYDVLLIADEVITGFGRTGRWFGLERYGVEPDIIQFAKGITSGYIPLGGIGVSDRVGEAINSVPPSRRWMHAFTYSGHPTCCAVALKNIEILEREGLIDRAAKSGARMLEELRTLESLDGVGNVRGLGMMAAVEVVADKATKQQFPAEIGMTQKLTDALLDRGLYTRVAMDCICVAPPLVTSDAQIDRIVGIIGETVSAVVSEAVSVKP